MIIASEILIARFAKIRQYAVRSDNYNRPYIARQLGVAYPGLTFEIISWERLSRSLAKIEIKVTKGTAEQSIEFEHPCKRVPAVYAQVLPMLSKNRADWARL